MLGETEYPSESNLEHRLKKFNQQHWEEALAGVFAKAAIDLEFRHLCLTNPRAAVHEVAPDLALPADFKVVFVNKGDEVLHMYALPTPLKTSPLLEDPLRRYTQEALDSLTNGWTGGGTPWGVGGQGGGDSGDGGKGSTK